MEINFENKDYTCKIETANEKKINVELAEIGLLKYKGNLSLEEVYSQIPAFTDYTIEECIASIEDLEKEKFILKTESEKLKLDITTKVLKKLKHLNINLDAVSESKADTIESLTKKTKANAEKIKNLEEELETLKRKLARKKKIFDSRTNSTII